MEGGYGQEKEGCHCQQEAEVAFGQVVGGTVEPRRQAEEGGIARHEPVFAREQRQQRFSDSRRRETFRSEACLQPIGEDGISQHDEHQPQQFARAEADAEPSRQEYEERNARVAHSVDEQQDALRHGVGGSEGVAPCVHGYDKHDSRQAQQLVVGLSRFLHNVVY